MKTLIVPDPTWQENPTDEQLARLVGAMAPWGECALLVAAETWPDDGGSRIEWAGVTEWIVVAQGGVTDWPAANWVRRIVSLAGDFSHIVAAASTFGSTVLPQVAARLDRAMVTGVQRIQSPDTFVRPVLAGNGLATIRATGQPVCLTLHLAGFAPAARINQPTPRIRHLTAPLLVDGSGARLLARTPIVRGQRPDLASARVVVAGGGGLAKAGHFALIEALADTLGAAVGASRAAVDAELAPTAWQIGQTGHIIAPDLYIGIGISGAIQHLAGIKGAKTIVAINHDPSAPLMRVADFALEADLYEAVPALIRALKTPPP